MLNCIFESDRSCANLLHWMEPHAIELVSDKIISEMDDVKSALTGTISLITPETLLAWDINMFIGTLVKETAPITSHMLKTAVQTKHAKQQNKIKSCSTACNVIITQLAKERSQLSLYFATPFTLCLWTNGASHQTIKALHKCGRPVVVLIPQSLLSNEHLRPRKYSPEHLLFSMKSKTAIPPICYLIRTSTIDESSITGNITVIHDVYINQLKMTHELLADQAIPSINDQSTNACIRGAKALRTQDVNTFTRLQNLQLSFGLFHLCMNLIWALLHIHCGSIHQIGSLSYFFALLDHTRLGCEHPDYHTLLAMLLQVLQGIILNAWRVKCGHLSLAAFASSNSSPDELLRIADQIILNHVTIAPEPSKKKTTDANGTEPASNTDSDDVHRNLRVLTRDLLHVLELVHTTAQGDFGHIEDILGNLAMIFCGAGSNNYCSEILHFLYNLKKFLKLFFASKGIYASWDRLGDISTTVDLLQSVRKQVGRALGIAYHGISHTMPDMSAAINKVAHKVSKLELHIFKPDRLENDSIRRVVDTLAAGEQKLKSSTLATFNRKVRGMMAGEGIEIEEDETPQVSFDLSHDLDLEEEHEN
ncbi:hypothetical protein BDN67DRAFT_985220 [Paxillus ammoniavirescens]|nr:hypothetical protein BDN67DRAFT_985220 [Paxillus ammoniavirescens]